MLDTYGCYFVKVARTGFCSIKKVPMPNTSITALLVKTTYNDRQILTIKFTPKLFRSKHMVLF